MEHHESGGLDDKACEKSSAGRFSSGSFSCLLSHDRSLTFLLSFFPPLSQKFRIAQYKPDSSGFDMSILDTTTHEFAI